MKTLKEILCEEAPVKSTKSPMQRRREMGRRMKLLAKKSSTKMKKKRARLKRRSTDKLAKTAQRKAKMMVINRSMGGSVKYNELPLQKRIQIDQKIVARKAKVIQKIAKKLGMTATNYNKTVSGGSRTEIRKESVNEMTGINVPELIRTTVHRLTHPRGYDKIIQKYIQDVGMEKQKSGSKDTNAVSKNCPAI